MIDDKLSVAILYSVPISLRYLLTQRVDVDAQDNQGWTPLMCLAANRGTMEIANTLIKVSMASGKLA